MIVGITGTFGSGKSAVAKILSRATKAKIIDADKIAKSMLYRQDVIRQIKTVFPDAAINEKVSREKLASIVFNDRKQLTKLEKIIHPLVIKEIKRKIKGNAIIDAPLLIEAGLHEMCDAIIVVRCKEAVRVKRLMNKGFSKEEIVLRTAMQLPLKKKILNADYVIDNGGPIKETDKQVKQIARKLLP